MDAPFSLEAGNTLAGARIHAPAGSTCLRGTFPMNKTFRTVWNRARRQLVAVNETTKSHAQSSGSGQSFKGALVAAAVAGIFAAGAVQAAPVTADPAADWALSSLPASQKVDSALDFSGKNFGDSSFGASNTRVIWYGSNAAIASGTFGVYTGLTGTTMNLGQQYQTGKAYFGRLYLEGSIIDVGPKVNWTTGPVDQIGTTLWVNDLYAASTAELDIGALRVAKSFQNASSKIEADTLLVQSGASIKNDGTLTITNVSTGVADGAQKIFTSTTLSADALALGQTADATGSFLNSGTVNIAGTFSNYMTITDEDSGVWKVGTWINNADATIATAEVVDFTQGAGKTYTVKDFTVTNTFANEGTVNAQTATIAGGSNAGVLSVANNGSGTLVLEGAFDNKKTISADKLTTAAFTNSTADSAVTVAGEFTANGAITNAADAEITADAMTLTAGESTNAGTITLTNGLTAASKITSTGTLATGTGIKTRDGADVILNGAATGTTLALGGGSVTIANANAKFDNLSTSATSVLNNNQVNPIKKIVGSTSGLVYNQTGGSFATEDNSWFKYATLNISGGTINRTAEGANTLGSNTVNISGANALGITSGTQAGADWKNGQTVVTVGVLDSNATITLSTGGVIEAGKVTLTQANSLTFDGGALATTLDQMFDGVAPDTFEITTGDAADLETKVIGASSVKDLNAAFKNNIAFTANGGTLVVTDAVVSTQAIAESAQALKTLAGADKQDAVGVVYTGKVGSGSSASDIFSKATFDALEAEQAGSSKYLNPGLVFATMTYNNADDDANTNAKANLVVSKAAGAAADTNYLTRSIGFKKVTNAESITVNEGLEFSLVGDASNGYLMGAEGTGKVTADGAAATFSLGSLGVADGKGKLNAIDLKNGAALKVKAGAYEVKTLTDAADATVTISGGALTVADQMTLAGTYENAGTVQFLGAENTVNGVFTTKDNAKTTFQKAALHNKFSAGAGSVTRFENGFSVDAGMTMIADKAYRSAGRTVSKGDNTIAGHFIADAGASTVLDGTTTLTGAMASQGDVYAGTLNVSGQLELTNDSVLMTKALNIDASGMVVVQGGTMLLETFNSLGSISQTGTRVVTGDLAVYDVATDPDDMKDRVDALLGTDVTLTDPGATTNLYALMTADADQVADGVYGMSTFRMARAFAPMMLAAQPAAEEGPYDINKSEGFASVLPAGTYTANQIWGGTAANPHVSFNGDVTIADGAVLTGYDAFYVQEGSTLAFTGKGSGQFKTVESSDGTTRDSYLVVAGNVDVAAESAVDAATLVLGKSGVFTNKGTAGGDKLVLTDNAAFTVTAGGNSVFAKAELEGGSLRVENGFMGFGLNAADAHKLTKQKAVLGLGLETLDASKSAVLVGTLGPNEAAPKAGEAYFGSDSALVLSTVQLGKSGALKGDKTNPGKLTVKKGSVLAVTNAAWGKHVLVTEGYDLTGIEEGAWSGENFVDGTGKHLETKVEGGSLMLVVGSESIQDSGMDMAAGGLIDSVISENAEIRDTASDAADVRFIARVLEDQYGGTDAEKERTWNSVVQLGAASGFDAYVLDEAQSLMNTVDARASGAAGAPALDRSGLWAAAVGRTTEADELEASGGMKGGYDADAYGFMMGGEKAFANGLKAGAGFAYVDADLDSKGDFAAVSTDGKLYGGFGYLGYGFANGFSLTGQAQILKSEGDVTEALPAAIDMGKAEASLESTVFALGLKGEYAFDLGPVAVTPHAGIRWVYTKADGYDVTLGGETAFSVEKENYSVVQFPVGLSVTGAFNAGGVSLKPYADLTFSANTGDTDRTATVRAATVGSKDVFTADVAGDYTAEASLGLAAETESFAFRAGYTGTFGDAGRQGHAFTGSVSWKF